MSLLPVKTCTCTQDKKQTAGADYDGQSLCSFKFPLNLRLECPDPSGSHCVD